MNHGGTFIIESDEDPVLVWPRIQLDDGCCHGATASKYGARRQTPVWIAENCTQCMECITACPDTALPNTAQDISTILSTATRAYVSDAAQRKVILDAVPVIEAGVRAKRCRVW